MYFSIKRLITSNYDDLFLLTVFNYKKIYPFMHLFAKRLDIFIENSIIKLFNCLTAILAE